MAEFIEVHCNGKRHLINTDWVEEIKENSEHDVTIFFAFTIPNGRDQDYLNVDETYNEIQHNIWR